MLTVSLTHREILIEIPTKRENYHAQHCPSSPHSGHPDGYGVSRFLGARRVSKVAAASRLYVHVHQLDANEVASTGLSFRSFTTDESHSFGGDYVELVPNERLRYKDRFDVPNLPGEIQITVTLKPVTVGTELSVVEEGLLDVIPVEACYLARQDSLESRAKLVEPEIHQ